MNETKWTGIICDEMEKCNAIIFACVAQKMQAPGWPDRQVTHRYWMGWLEFKGETTKVTKLQKKRIRDLNARQPGTAYVVRYPDKIEDQDGNLQALFANGLDLIKALQELRNECAH